MEFYGDGTHWPNRRCRGLLFFLAGPQNQQQNETTDLSERKRNASGQPLLYQVCFPHDQHVTWSGQSIDGEAAQCLALILVIGGVYVERARITHPFDPKSPIP